jgi:hypothetical protein
MDNQDWSETQGEALARRLRGLQPLEMDRRQRDRAIFAAGVAAGRAAGRPQRLTTAALVAVLAALVAVSVLVPSLHGPASRQAATPAPATPVRAAPVAAVEAPVPSAAVEVPPMISGDYIRLRNAVLERGLSALPTPKPMPGAPVRAYGSHRSQGG